MIPNTLRPILEAINKKSGQNLLVIDVKGITSFTDYIIIAEGALGRHLHAIADEIQREVQKSHPNHYLRLEGKNNEEWIVLDCAHAIIHLFIPPIRKKYDLETIWSKGTILKLDEGL